MTTKKFKLSKRSLDNLAFVHADLVRVVKRAIEITDIDFVVIEGWRTEVKQRKLVESGASMTMNSRHLTGHAVDLAAWVGGQVRWDWPLYAQIADAMLSASRELGVPIVWGGHWKTFKDGPHFKLDRKRYPA